MTETAAQQGANQQETGQKGFSIQRVYTKDMSFETPNSPKIFQQPWQPAIEVNLGSKANRLDEQYFEVVLTVTVTAKIEGNAAFLVEVQQAGIFGLPGFEENELGPMLGAYCPNILFPYAREVVSDLVVRGSFPQFQLQPVNFETLYLQQQAQARAQAEQQGEAAH